MNKEIDTIRAAFSLEAHPEGGFFKETYRSTGVIPDEILGNGFESARNYCTGILFLLTSDSFSAFHKIRQDEMWHFYQGTSLKIHMISPTGVYASQILGNDFNNGELPQFVVPAHCWFGAEVLQNNSYSFVGCTVSPGFDFKDFELATRAQLVDLCPSKADLIEKLTVA